MGWARSAVFREKVVEEDSHSTDLIVSGEKGHSIIFVWLITFSGFN